MFVQHIVVEEIVPCFEYTKLCLAIIFLRMRVDCRLVFKINRQKLKSRKANKKQKLHYLVLSIQKLF